MERQIKFRGKSLKNKKWVYGDLMSNICGTRIVRYKETDDGTKKRADWEYIDVEPDSVGQFTGLTDCNGKEIYEGDIVKFDCGLEATISYSQIEAAFMFDYRGGQSMPIGVMYVISDHVLFDAEVIGNIHDNPELFPNQLTAI